MALKYLQTDPTTAADQQAKLWAVYEAEQRAARGLKAGDSLDRRDGVVLPLAQAITVRYADVRVAADNSLAALPVDDYAQSKDGVGGLSLSAAVTADKLDPKVAPPTDATAEPATIEAGAKQ
jgi:hypothetical protein